MLDNHKLYLHQILKQIKKYDATKTSATQKEDVIFNVTDFLESSGISIQVADTIKKLMTLQL